MCVTHTEGGAILGAFSGRMRIFGMIGSDGRVGRLILPEAEPALQMREVGSGVRRLVGALNRRRTRATRAGTSASGVVNHLRPIGCGRRS